MDNYCISNRKIIFEAGSVVEFDFSIKQTLIFNHHIIVLLDIPADTCYNQNVFAVNFKGKTVWQIQGSDNLDRLGICPFTSIGISHYELICFNLCGFRLTVNPATGHVTSQVFNR